MPGRTPGTGPTPPITSTRTFQLPETSPTHGELLQMPDRHPTMMEPPVEELLNRVDSKFTLVSLAALRGRQINSYFNQLGEGLGTIVPPQVTSVSRKPLSIALEEIAAGKITYSRPEAEQQKGPEAEAEQ
jgi:DNA-directed RNA polymerase subunit omega